MEGSWWRDQKELDDEQLKVIDLSEDGKYMLIGPPGCGKTNLLLLRAKYFYGKGLKNLLFVTYTKELAAFIRTGIGNKGFLPEHVVSTYHSWAARYVRDHLGHAALGTSKEFTEDSRARLIELVGQATDLAVTEKQYDMILVDEAQDLSMEEIRHLMRLTDRIVVAGDRRQGIYGQNGLNAADELGL